MANLSGHAAGLLIGMVGPGEWPVEVDSMDSMDWVVDRRRKIVHFHDETL